MPSLFVQAFVIRLVHLLAAMEREFSTENVRTRVTTWCKFLVDLASSPAGQLETRKSFHLHSKCLLLVMETDSTQVVDLIVLPILQT